MIRHRESRSPIALKDESNSPGSQGTPGHSDAPAALGNDELRGLVREILAFSPGLADVLVAAGSPPALNN